MSTPDEALTCLAFSPDSQKIAYGTAPSGVTITHINSAGSQHIEAFAVLDRPGIVTWSSDGKKIMTASLDNQLRCWDAISLHTLGPPFQKHKETILAASFLPDSSHAISLSKDGEIFVWETISGRITRRGSVSKLHQTIFVATLSADGTLLVTGEGKKGIAWEIPACAQITEISLPDIPLLQAAIIPNGRGQVVFAFGDMSFGIWDTKTGSFKVHARFEVHSSDAILLAMAVSPDGGLLAVEIDGDDDGHPTHFYDKMGKEIASPTIRYIRPFAFSPDGNSFAASRVSSDLKGHSQKLIISSVEEILRHNRVFLDVPVTSDKSKHEQYSLPQGFFDQKERPGPSSREANPQASMGSPRLRRRRPRFRKAESNGRTVHSQAVPESDSQSHNHNSALSRLRKLVRYPRSHKARSPETVDSSHAHAEPRTVVTRSRQNASSEARQQEHGGDQDDTRSYESVVYAGQEQDTQSVKAHGCWNVFWTWLCFKSI